MLHGTVNDVSTFNTKTTNEINTETSKEKNIKKHKILITN
jgi:hypothetical protein